MSPHREPPGLKVNVAPPEPEEFAQAEPAGHGHHEEGFQPVSPGHSEEPSDLIGEEGFTGRAAIGYDHGYDGEVFFLGLALDERYVEGWVEGCLERIGEDDPEEERTFRDLWEDETQREVLVESLKADCEVRPGRPTG